MKSIITVLAIIGAIIYLPDWSFLSGSITGYEIMCYYTTKKCRPMTSSNYKPDIKNQRVIYKSISGATTYQSCSVFNRKNWKCKDNDPSIEFGFVDGKHYYLHTEAWNAWEDLGEWKQVSRLVYIYTVVKDFFDNM